MNWFTEKFEADIIYLVRHPGAVAESLVRNGLKSAAQTCLSDSIYCKTHLNSAQIRLAQEILEQGSPFQQCVLEWCLDNLHPLRVQRERPWLTLLRRTGFAASGSDQVALRAPEAALSRTDVEGALAPLADFLCGFEAGCPSGRAGAVGHPLAGVGRGRGIRRCG